MIKKMTERAIFSPDAIDHWNFMRKSEEILRYIHDIEKLFNWEDRQTLQKAADVITQLMNKKMNEQEFRLKDITT